MKKTVSILLICMTVACSSCQTDKPPKHLMIDCAYFKCEKCRSLEGGIYGKGPLKLLHNPEGKKCIHNWQPISREEFKALGTEWKGVDWKTESLWWNR